MERTELRNRMTALLEVMCEGAYEREEVMALSLLGALSGESVFLLGLPGVGKSMIARRLKLAFRDSTGFEYLMSRFSTPDEIFGPVSISKLKDEDTYERVTSGYLPEADIVFLDEIWKAGPAIQNSLLTAINEKIFRNGDHDMRLPLKGLIAASNELPAEGEGLEALWDRFLIRYIVEPIGGKDNFFRLIDSRRAAEPIVAPELSFTPEEYDSLSDMIAAVEIPDHIRELVFALRTRYVNMAAVQEKNGEDTEADKIPYVSDRRWKKIVWILKASACLNGRESVDLSDCMLMEHLIWDHDSEVEMVRKDLAEEVTKGFIRARKDLSGGKAGTGLYSTDGGSNLIVDMNGTLLTISAEDYGKLSERPLWGSIDSSNTLSVNEKSGQFSIRVTKPGSVTINSYIYPLRKNSTESPSPLSVKVDAGATVEEFRRMVKENIFVYGSRRGVLVESILNRYDSRAKR